VAVHAAQGDHSLLGGDPSRLVQQLQDQVTRLTQQLKSRDIHIESLAQHNASLTDSISRMQRDAAAMWQNRTAPCPLPDSTEPLRVKLLVEDLKSASTQIETLTQQLVTLQRRSTILGVSVLQLKWRYSISQAVANESKQHIKRLQFINYEAVEHIQKYRNRIAVLESDILAFKEQFHLQRQLPTRNSPQNCDIATQTDNDLRTPKTAPVLMAPITTRSLPLSPRDAETAFELFDTARCGTIPTSRLPQVLTVLGLIPGEPCEGRDTVLANIDAKFSAYVDRTEFLSIVAFCQRPSEKPMVATSNGHRSSDIKIFYPEVRNQPLTDRELTALFLLFDWGPTSGVSLTHIPMQLSLLGIPICDDVVMDALLEVDKDLSGVLTFAQYKAVVLAIQSRYF